MYQIIFHKTGVTYTCINPLFHFVADSE